jgi:tRNA G18 (ribose-2'-O)-methylase SpoU
VPLPERITDPADPRLELYGGVRDPELLAAHGLFVAESRAVIARALARPELRCRSLLLTDAAYAALSPLAGEARTLVVDRSVLHGLTGFHIHQGALALFERPAPATLGALLARAAGRPLVVLDRVSDPDNVGSIFRSASAFGAGGVLLLPGCADPLYRKAIRTSMGAVFAVPHDDAPGSAALGELRAAGYALAAFTPARDALVLSKWLRSGPQALLFGNEGDGLPPELLALASTRVRIPIDDSVDSLGVAVAAAIALQHIV